MWRSGRDSHPHADPVAALRAPIVANSMLERELAELYAKVSHGFIRGRRVKPKV